MPYCKYCGQFLDNEALFCSSCGNKVVIKNDSFGLEQNERRQYEISVENGMFNIKGDFLYLEDMDFHSNKGYADGAPVHDYIGLGFLSKRSYRKIFIFLVVGTIFTFFKNVIDYLDKFGVSFSLINIVYYILMGICVYNLVRIFMDKKNVIEISFIGKRFAVPQSSMDDDELHELKSVLEKKVQS